MNNGWIKLHRELTNWEWYKNSNMVHLFLHLMLLANHEEQKWRGQIIQRGQLITGRFSLSKDTGISEQSIRTCITRLKSTNEITTKSTNKNTLITISNYEKYQKDDKKSTNKLTYGLTNNQPTTNQQLTTNNNIKNDKNVKNTATSEVAGINQIMEIFSRINPTLSWGNKTIRNSASDFIKKFTLEEAKRMCEAIISVQGKPYAPRATNPYQAWTKLADFKFYFDGLKNKQKEVFKI
jgi:hypothetical protein